MTTEERLNRLEKEVTSLKERNARVETDKAWEISLTRTISVSLVTYAVTAFVFYLIGVGSYLLSALVPATAYFISVQSLPALKRWWKAKL
ncbi:MAG: hypothetical protein WEC39_02005 [Patescibacteria group bacterium]